MFSHNVYFLAKKIAKKLWVKILWSSDEAYFYSLTTNGKHHGAAQRGFVRGIDRPHCLAA